MVLEYRFLGSLIPMIDSMSMRLNTIILIGTMKEHFLTVVLLLILMACGNKAAQKPGGKPDKTSIKQKKSQKEPQESLIYDSSETADDLSSVFSSLSSDNSDLGHGEGNVPISFRFMRHGFSEANKFEETEKEIALQDKQKQKNSKNKFRDSRNGIKNSLKDMYQKGIKSITKEDFKNLGNHTKDYFKHGGNVIKYTSTSLFHDKIKSKGQMRISDPGLDEIGFEQCKTARKHVKGAISVVLCSPLLRAIETAITTFGEDVDKIILMPYFAEIMAKFGSTIDLAPGMKGKNNNPSTPEYQRLRMLEHGISETMINKVDYRFVLNNKGKFKRIACQGSLKKFMLFLGDHMAEILSLCGVPLTPGMTVTIYVVGHSLWMKRKLGESGIPKPENTTIIQVPGNYNINSTKTKLRSRVNSFHDNTKNKKHVKILFKGVKHHHTSSPPPITN